MVGAACEGLALTLDRTGADGCDGDGVVEADDETASVGAGPAAFVRTAAALGPRSAPTSVSCAGVRPAMMRKLKLTGTELRPATVVWPVGETGG